MTRSDIADYLGLTIETVSRTLTRLRAEGLIDLASQSEVIVCNSVGARGAGGRPALTSKAGVCARPDSNRQGVSSGGF